MIKIDPTDLRIDLDKEFEKLEQKRKELEMKKESSESGFSNEEDQYNEISQIS